MMGKLERRLGARKVKDFEGNHDRDHATERNWGPVGNRTFKIPKDRTTWENHGTDGPRGKKTRIALSPFLCRADARCPRKSFRASIPRSPATTTTSEAQQQEPGWGPGDHRLRSTALRHGASAGTRLTVASAPSTARPSGSLHSAGRKRTDARPTIDLRSHFTGPESRWEMRSGVSNIS